MSDRVGIMDWAYWTVHSLSFSATMGVIIHALPLICALPAGIFYCYQMYKTPEIQNWRRRRRERLLNKYKAKVRELERPHNS